MNNQKLTTKEEITAWLGDMDIEDYTLVPDPTHGFVVNVNGSVDLCGRQLHSIPVQFERIAGTFFLTKNKLTTLSGSPQSVGGDFFCAVNNLTSLEHAPRSVGGVFYCSNNDLVNLRYCPQSVGGFFHCHRNPRLGATQNLVVFSDILQIHLQTAEIEEEKEKLDALLCREYPYNQKIGTLKI